MHIQVNTDSHIQGGEELRRHAQAIVEGALARFRERITRVEVHLTDESSSAKASDDDKRCLMEVRLAGLQPIAVSHRAASIEQALGGAADKLERALDSTLGRLRTLEARPAQGNDQEN